MTEVKRQPVKVAKHQVPGTSIYLDKVENYNHPLVPTVDASYVFRQDLCEEVAYCLETGQNCILVGDAGTGKSSLIEQLAAQLNRPLRRMNAHGESDTTVFVGRDYPSLDEHGNRVMVYRRGPLAEAVEKGFWFLLDELDAALQPVLFVMQQLLEDDGRLVLEDTDGTVIRKHPAFRFFSTANTVGIAGRNRMLYTGTMQKLNEATLDRFGCVIHVQNMEPDLEEQVISKKVPDLDGDYIKAIVKIANETRNNLQDDRLSCTFSTRRCIQWAQAMTRFHPLRAAKVTVLNKLNQDDYKVLEGVVQRFFGD